MRGDRVGKSRARYRGLHCEPLESRQMLSVAPSEPEQLVVALPSSAKIARADLQSFLSQHDWPHWVDSSVLSSAQLILSNPKAVGGGETLVKISLPEGVTEASAKAELSGAAFVSWVLLS